MQGSTPSPKTKSREAHHDSAPSPKTKSLEASQLDVNTRQLASQTFTSINQQPCPCISTAPMRTLDLRRYVRTFAGSAFLSRSANYSDSPDPKIPDPKILIHFNFLSAAIRREQRRQQHLLSALNLYAQRASFYGSVPHGYDVFQFSVPRLREDYSHLRLDDVVQLRQLRLDSDGEPRGMSSWLANGGLACGIPAPGFSGVQYDARIWWTDMMNERLLLNIDDFLPESCVFNISFTASDELFHACQDTLSLALETLHQETTGKMRRQWLRSMLFPEQSDGTLQHELDRVRSDWELQDTDLNFQQVKAIDSVRKSNYGSLPFLIFGPPGTGKTKSLVELALQLQRERARHILVCAPSDQAADTLTQHLSAVLQQPHMLRLNSPKRCPGGLPPSLLQYCCIQDGIFCIPPFSKLLSFGTVVTTCRDAAYLLSVRLSNQALYSLEYDLKKSIHPGRSAWPHLHWDSLLLDDAAQATEPEALIPVMVVAPPPAGRIRYTPRLVLAGIDKQLSAGLASKGGTSINLFDRLMQRPVYSEHPLVRSTSNSKPWLTEEMLPALRPAFSKLIRDYRGPQNRTDSGPSLEEAATSTMDEGTRTMA